MELVLFPYSTGQPHFKLVNAPDDKAVAMFEVSPALFISGIAKLSKLGGDQVMNKQPFVAEQVKT